MFGSTARHALIALFVTAVLAGCGATPPQAPRAQAKKLGASTGDISTECGLTYQVTAFPGDHRNELASLETQAKASVRSLASVYVKNPAWIYQGETVGQIVTDAVAMLHACGLNEAARTLERTTGLTAAAGADRRHDPVGAADHRVDHRRQALLEAAQQMPLVAVTGDEAPVGQSGQGVRD